MDRDVQSSEPASQLLSVAAEVVPDWMRRITLQAAAAGGVDPAALAGAVDSMVASETARLIDDLGRLLGSDVDQQRTNPLSLFRDAVAAPTALLRSFGVPAPQPDRFGAARFPDDAYGLGPATWSDIDPRLHEPGLTWGAWKAMIVLHRRRDEGVR